MVDRPIIFGDEPNPVPEKKPEGVKAKPPPVMDGALFNKDGDLVGYVVDIQTTTNTIDVSTFDSPSAFMKGSTRTRAEIDVSNLDALKAAFGMILKP